MLQARLVSAGPRSPAIHSESGGQRPRIRKSTITIATAVSPQVIAITVSKSLLSAS